MLSWPIRDHNTLRAGEAEGAVIARDIRYMARYVAYWLIVEFEKDRRRTCVPSSFSRCATT